ncbi:MAG: ATP synthase F1 subunit gamma [Dehalococcoidales bacterium]|nr:ATP synthase F1 subunit gamma [Dehalococcoidales bacterium]
MADIRLIRRRIKGVQSIAKITRAMEMIATSKMKRTQERGLAGRPYSEKIRQVIADLAASPQTGRTLHPLLQRRPVTKIAILYITPDRGLCGGLIANLNRATGSFITDQEVPVSLVCVGNKGLDFMRRSGRDIRAEFSWLGDRPSYLDILPISRIIIDDYANGEIDAAYVAYSQFVSTMAQRAVVQPLVPVEPAEIPASQNVDFIYEPNAERVLQELLPRFIEMQVYQAILEAIASEQSARMVAMRNATENAGELGSELTLMYNKARQESITKELLDITGGVEALSE